MEMRTTVQGWPRLPRDLYLINLTCTRDRGVYDIEATTRRCRDHRSRNSRRSGAVMGHLRETGRGKL